MPRFEDPTLEVRRMEEGRDRFRRSNRGGDDLPTKIVFALIVVGLLTWFVRFYLSAHSAAAVTHH